MDIVPHSEVKWTLPEVGSQAMEEPAARRALSEMGWGERWTARVPGCEAELGEVSVRGSGGEKRAHWGEEETQPHTASSLRRQHWPSCLPGSCTLAAGSHAPSVVYPKRSQLGRVKPAVYHGCPGQAGVGGGGVLLAPSDGDVAEQTVHDTQILRAWEGEAEGPRTREG